MGSARGEGCGWGQGTLRRGGERGKVGGVSLNPETGGEVGKYGWRGLDLVLVMSVNPGFGGQSFLPDVLPKIRALRALANQQSHPIHIEVDGGIKPGTAAQVVAAGADVLVAGSAIYGQSDYRAAIAAIRADAMSVLPTVETVAKGT